MQNLRSFKETSKTIRSARLGHKKNYSQSDVSHLLGYKNGQFISNVERGLCSVPLKMIAKLCGILEIDTESLCMAMRSDHNQTLNNFVAESKKLNIDNVKTPAKTKRIMVK